MLAFIGDTPSRVLLAQYLVVLVISSIVAYFLLTYEFPIHEWTWRLYYSMAAVGVSAGFSFLVRLAVAFYGNTPTQDLVFAASFILLSAILVLPFKPSRTSLDSVGP